MMQISTVAYGFVASPKLDCQVESHQKDSWELQQELCYYDVLLLLCLLRNLPYLEAFGKMLTRPKPLSSLHPAEASEVRNCLSKSWPWPLRVKEDSLRRPRMA